VFVDLVIQHAMRMRHIVICGLPRSIICFQIKLDWTVCTCLTEIYDGTDMYRIYYIQNNYTFRHFSLAIFRMRNEKISKQLYSTSVGCIQLGGKR